MDWRAENTWHDKPGVGEKGRLSAGHAWLNGQQSIPLDAACDAHWTHHRVRRTRRAKRPIVCVVFLSQGCISSMVSCWDVGCRCSGPQSHPWGWLATVVCSGVAGNKGGFYSGEPACYQGGKENEGVTYPSEKEKETRAEFPSILYKTTSLVHDSIKEAQPPRHARKTGKQFRPFILDRQGSLHLSSNFVLFPFIFLEKSLRNWKSMK